MTNRFFKTMKTNKNWLTFSLYAISILMFATALYLSVANNPNRITEKVFFIGLTILFIAMLNIWAKRSRKYYVILMGISVLLIFLLFKFGIGALVNIQSQYQIQGRWAEDVAWSVGGIFFAGFMAGIVGIFVCIAQWR